MRAEQRLITQVAGIRQSVEVLEVSIGHARALLAKAKLTALGQGERSAAAGDVAEAMELLRRMAAELDDLQAAVAPPAPAAPAKRTRRSTRKGAKG